MIGDCRRRLWSQGGRPRKGGWRTPPLRTRLAVVSLLVVLLFLTEAAGSAYLSGTIQASSTLSQSVNEFPQYLRNTSGKYSSANARGPSTSQLNLTVGEIKAFPSTNSFNDWTLVNSSVRIYAAPKFSGSVTYNGSSGDEAGTSVTAINITIDGSTGVSAVIIGAPHAQVSSSGCGGSSSGAVFMFFGHTPLNSSYNWNQANLTICGNETGMLFGWSVAGVENMSGPGGTGVAIGSPNFTWCQGANTNLLTSSCSPTPANHAGGIWLITRTNLSHALSSFQWHPGTHSTISIGTLWSAGEATLIACAVVSCEGEESGYSLSPIANTTAGAIKNGYDDVISGAPYYNESGKVGVGRVDVISYTCVVTTNGCTIGGILNPSPASGAHFGWAVTNVTDFGGGDLQDPAVSAPGSSTVYLYPGDNVPGTYNGNLVGVTAAWPPIRSIPGSANTEFGWSIAGMSHHGATTDGGPALIVGEPGWSSTTSTQISYATQAAFVATGSSLAGANPSGGVYAAPSDTISPTNLSLATNSLISSFAWTFPEPGVTTGTCTPQPIPGNCYTVVGPYFKTPNDYDVYGQASLTSPPAVGFTTFYMRVDSGGGGVVQGAYFSGTNTYPLWDVGMEGGYFVYGMREQDTAASDFVVPTDVAYTVGQWYRLTISYNDNIDLYSLLVNGVLIMDNSTFINEIAGTVGPLNELTFGEFGSWTFNKMQADFNGFMLGTYPTGSSATYSGPSSAMPGNIVQVNATVNGTSYGRTGLTIDLSRTGGAPWDALPASGGTDSFSSGESIGSTFAFQIVFTESPHNPSYSPQVYSISFQITYKKDQGSEGKVTIFYPGSAHTGQLSNSTYSQFSSSGSSLQPSGATKTPYPPGNWNSYIETNATTGAGQSYLHLVMSDIYQETFDADNNGQSLLPAGYNWSYVGTAPTFAASNAHYVSGPMSVEFVAGSSTKESGAATYDPTGNYLSKTTGILSEYVFPVSGSFEVAATGPGRTIDVGPTLGFVSQSLKSGLLYTTAGSTGFTFHYGVWYWVVLMYNDSAGQYTSYVNSTSGQLSLLASNSTYRNTADTQTNAPFFWNENLSALGTYVGTTFYVDNLRLMTHDPADVNASGLPVMPDGNYTSSITNTPGPVAQVTAFWNATVPSGTTLQILVTRDGGTDWSPPLRSGTAYNFTVGEPVGNQLGYRAVISSSNGWTPFLFNVALHYTYELPAVNLTGPGSALAQFGWSVSSGGDLDHDGKMDLAVGAPGVSSSTGAVFVYFGQAWTPGTLIPTSEANVTYAGEVAGDQFGYSIFAGDFNVSAPGPPPQLLVGAPFNGAGGTDAGRVYLLGSSPPTLQVELGYTASPHDITLATGEMEVSVQGFQVLALTMSTTTIPNTATLYLNVSNVFDASLNWGSPVLVVWINSGNVNVASYYYCGYYLADP